MTACSSLLLLGLLPGCDDGMTVVDGAPDVPSDVATTTVNTDAVVRALGASGSQVVVGTPLGASVVVEVTLEPLAVVDEANVADATGAVQAITSDDESLWLLGDQGLFTLHGERLLRSPASEALADLDARAVAMDGDALWLAAEQGVYRHAGGTLEQWSIDEVGKADAIASAGGVVLVADATALIELVPGEDHHEVVVDGEGEIHDLVASPDGTIYAATDRGLVVRFADGIYERHTFSDDDEPARVTALAVDGDAVVAATSIGILRFDGDDAVGLAPVPAAIADVTDLTVDAFGHVWAGGQSSLVGHYVGAPSSYLADVAPVLSERCAGCHVEGGGGPPIDFFDPQAAIDRADVIVDRVTAGTMPPAGATALSAAEIQAIVRWYETGQQP